MKYSQEIHGSKARVKLLEGARRVYKAVAPTLGSLGRNQVIWKEYRTKVINDGVKTAVEINPKNPFENAGAEIIKQAAQRQVDLVGDGTTLVILLGYSIASEAMKIIESGVNPMTLRSSLEKGRDILIDEIKKFSKPIKTKTEKIQVATISANNEHLGKMIGETYHKAGADAIMTAEQVTGPETFIDHQEGMQIDSGYKTEWFITNPRSMTATVTKARILVTDYKLDNIQDLIPLLKTMLDARETNFVVIGEDVEGSVLASLVLNKQKGQVNSLAIKAPSFQTERVLQDIAIVVGAKFISSKTKMDLKKVTLDDLGYANRVTSTKDATVIIEGKGQAKDVKNRIASIKNQIKEEKNDFEKQKLKERLAKLTGGVYVVKVGGATEVEAEEKFERADDAIRATRAAIEGGIIPGGEIIFLQTKEALKPKNEYEDYAYRILKKALDRPFNKLMENSGFDSGAMKAKLIAQDYGVDITTGEIVKMFEKGIIDPANVAIEAIRNSISVAIAMITSDGIIVELEEEKK